MSFLHPDTLVPIEKLWDFMIQRDSLESPDCIAVLGSTDIYVPLQAAALIATFRPKMVICSGGIAHTDDLLATKWTESEANVFEKLIKSSIPNEIEIIKDEMSKNTADNIINIINIVSREPELKEICLIHKPFMTLRLRLTINRQFPDFRCKIYCGKLSFIDYVKTVINPISLIHIIVGDFDRIIKYPDLGYTENIFPPREVLNAHKQLIDQGYTKHLL